MSEGRKPAARLVAIIPAPKDGDRDQWLEIGALWEVAAEGNVEYTGHMNVTPVQWGDPNLPRRVAIVRREER